MFSRIYVVTVVLLIFYQDVNGAMKKSWKSAANFDAEIPKFTPFNNEGDLSDESNLNEVQLKTTQVPTSPSPSAETLTSKIRSKIKAPSKYVADIYNQIRHGPPTNANTDFGTFDADMSHHESDQPQHQETANDEIDIEQVLNQLNQEADKHDLENDSIENSVDSDDELEVSSGANSTQFKVGPLMNVTIDSGESVVNVNLNQNTLKEIFTGRGKKYNMLERVVPLFILPFLIQSAVVPFMVTMIKLFLMKSLFAGKIAVLLLLLGALKSHQNSIYMKSMQHSPYFLKDYPLSYPERRLETNFEALSPFKGEQGYKVEGKPEAFVN